MLFAFTLINFISAVEEREGLPSSEYIDYLLDKAIRTGKLTDEEKILLEKVNDSYKMPQSKIDTI